MQNHFSDLTIFFEIQFKNALNLIFPSFKMPSKGFHSRISKQGLLFDICDFSIFKIWSERVTISVGHPVLWKFLPFGIMVIMVFKDQLISE